MAAGTMLRPDCSILSYPWPLTPPPKAGVSNSDKIYLEKQLGAFLMLAGTLFILLATLRSNRPLQRHLHIFRCVENGRRNRIKQEQQVTTGHFPPFSHFGLGIILDDYKRRKPLIGHTWESHRCLRHPHVTLQADATYTRQTKAERSSTAT